MDPLPVLNSCKFQHAMLAFPLGADLAGRLGHCARGTAPELHRALCRRPRLGRPRSLRPSGHPHAASRPDGGRGDAPDELLCGVVLRPVPGGPDDRIISAACEPRFQPRPRGDDGHSPRRGHRGRTAQGQRLCHQDDRQVASRRRSGIPASPARIRQLVRDSLFQRHVALPPCDADPPAGERAHDFGPPARGHDRIRRAGELLQLGTGAGVSATAAADAR